MPQKRETMISWMLNIYKETEEIYSSFRQRLCGSCYGLWLEMTAETLVSLWMESRSTLVLRSLSSKRYAPDSCRRDAKWLEGRVCWSYVLHINFVYSEHSGKSVIERICNRYK